MQRVLTLWQGPITDREHTLQLLLIVDLIADWARNSFRRTLIDQLLSLTTDPTPSLVNGTEIGSVRGDRPMPIPFNYKPATTRNASDSNAHKEHVDLLRFFDDDEKTNEAIRDASLVERNLCAIELTLENLDLFLGALTTNTRQERREAAKFLDLFVQEHAWCVSAQTLDEIERLWTNHDRISSEMRTPDEQFIVRFGLACEVSWPGRESRSLSSEPSAWKIVHSLSYVAVSVKVWTELEKRGRKPKSWAGDKDSALYVDQAAVLKLFKRAKKTPTRSLLAAALQSTNVVSSHCISKPRSSSRKVLSCEARQGELLWLAETQSLSVVDYPTSVYHLLATGRIAPTFSFLRFSLETGHNDHSHAPASDYLQPDIACSLLNSETASEILHESTSLVLLKTKRSPKSSNGQPQLCMFIIDTNKAHEQYAGYALNLHSKQKSPMTRFFDLSNIQFFMGGLSQGSELPPSRLRRPFVPMRTEERDSHLSAFSQFLQNTITTIAELKASKGNILPKSRSSQRYNDLKHRGTWNLSRKNTGSMLVKAARKHQFDVLVKYMQLCVDAEYERLRARRDEEQRLQRPKKLKVRLPGGATTTRYLRSSSGKAGPQEESLSKLPTLEEAVLDASTRYGLSNTRSKTRKDPDFVSIESPFREGRRRKRAAPKKVSKRPIVISDNSDNDGDKRKRKKPRVVKDHRH